MLPERLKDQLKMGKELWQQLAKLESEILSNHKQQMVRQLDAARQIEKQRPEILSLINQLGEILDEETLAHSEAIINAPLFHPLFEELMIAQDNGITDEQLFKEEQEELKEDIEDHFDYPYPEEVKAMQELVHVYGQVDETAQAAFDKNDIPGLYELLEEDQQQVIDALLLEEGMKSQIERLSDTLAILNDSPYRFDTEASEDVHLANDLQDMSLFLNRLRAALQKSIELKQASPDLLNIIKELEVEEQDAKEAGMEEWLDGLLDTDAYDMEGLFNSIIEIDEGDDKNWEEVTNPRFLEGSVVAISAVNWLPEVYGIGSKKQFSPPEDARGRVMEAYTDGEKVIYEVALDSHTLHALPVEYIQQTCQEAEDSFAYHIFDENDLKASVPRDEEDEALIAYKQLFNRYFWGNTDKDEDARIIYNVLMANPRESDLFNWHQYFSEFVDFPFKARVEGLIGWEELPPETELDVLTLASIERHEEEEEEFGLLVFVKHGSETLYFPLVELLPIDEKTDSGKAVLAYRWWADMMV